MALRVQEHISLTKPGEAAKGNEMLKNELLEKLSK